MSQSSMINNNFLEIEKEIGMVLDYYHYHLTPKIHINIGTGIDISISDLAHTIKQIIGFSGELYFNADKPDGTMKKLTDPSKLHSLGWHHKVEINEGIRRMYEWYTGETDAN